MNRELLFAWTATNYEGHYPPYLSAYLVDGRVEIYARSPAKENGDCGDVAYVPMPLEVARAMFAQAVAKTV